jgi:uncharacterized protein YlzI (FlbEa/FlbD family)
MNKLIRIMDQGNPTYINPAFVESVESDGQYTLIYLKGHASLATKEDTVELVRRFNQGIVSPVDSPFVKAVKKEQANES